MAADNELSSRHVKTLKGSGVGPDARRKNLWNSTGIADYWYLKRTWTLLGPGTGSVGKLIKNAIFPDKPVENDNRKVISIVSESDKDDGGEKGGGDLDASLTLTNVTDSQYKKDSSAHIISLSNKKKRESDSQDVVFEPPKVASIDDLVALIDLYYGLRKQWETASFNEKANLDDNLRDLEEKLSHCGIHDQQKLYSTMLNYYSHNSLLTNLFHLFVADAEFGFTGFFEKDVIFNNTTNGLNTVFATPALKYIFFGGIAIAATIGFFLYTAQTYESLKNENNRTDQVLLVWNWLLKLGETIAVDWAIAAALLKSGAQTATMAGSGLLLLPGLFLIHLGFQFLGDFTKFCRTWYKLCKSDDHDERRAHAQTMVRLGLQMIKTALMGAFVGLMMIAGVSNPVTLGVIMGVMLTFALGLFIWDHLPKSWQRSVKSSCRFFRKDSYKRENIELAKIEHGSVIDDSKIPANNMDGGLDHSAGVDADADVNYDKRNDNEITPAVKDMMVT